MQWITSAALLSTTCLHFASQAIGILLQQKVELIEGTGFPKLYNSESGLIVSGWHCNPVITRLMGL